METVSIPHMHDRLTLAHALDRAVQKNFVRTVRAVEWLIGIEVQGCPALEDTPNAKNLDERLEQASAIDTLGLLTPPVIEALTASFPMLLCIARELQWTIDFTVCQDRVPITTKFVFPFSQSL